MDLDYTGHPFLDVGLATLTAFARKRHPRELTEEDLKQAADYMAQNYVVNPLRSFLTVAFPNSGFTNPAFFKSPQKQSQYAQNVLYAFAVPQSTGELDPWLEQPATHISYDVKGQLQPGRAYRQHVPLTTGEDYINFHPYGDAGIPLHGITMLAIHMLPLGCAKVGGRLLAVHSDDPDLILHYARTFLRTNRQNVTIAQAAGEKKLPDTSPRKPRTLLVEHLLEAQRQAHRLGEDTPPTTITAYHFTNSGQGADLDIYPLPLEVSAFLAAVQSPRYRHAWQALTQRAWQITKAKRGKEAPPPTYNRLYEDLFALPEQAAYFIRTYFLRRPNRIRPWKKDEDPTRTYHSAQEAHLISWPLTQLFLKKVMHMDPTRIQHIRELGDRLADYVINQNDRRFFFNFYTARSYAQMRAALIKASQAEVKAGRPPLITLDVFLSVFEETEGIPYEDWRLGRDLVLIRMFEQLYQQGWLQQHAQELPEEEPETTESI